MHILRALALLVLLVSTASAGGRTRTRRRKKFASSPARSATAALNADNFDLQVPVAYHPRTVNKLREHEAEHPEHTSETHAARRTVALGQPVAVTQDERAVFERRVLADEDWITWEEAEAEECVGPLRLEFVKFYNGSDDFLAAAEHCYREGQIVTQSNMGGPQVGTGGAQACEEDEVITNLTKSVVDVRLDWVQEYFRDTFGVKQAQTGITISPSAQNNYPFEGNTNGPQDGGDYLCDTTLAGQCPPSTYPDADLVIIVTLHPLSAEKSGIAGYASCLQSDQFGRCTVGFFEWVPDTLSPSQLLFPDVAMLERATALHECMHVLGGIKNSPLFRDATTGAAQSNSYKLLIGEQTGAHISKQVAIWVTPGVVAMAREQFACPNITGVPLEDLPSGANGHWESRLMGSEVMSYGLTTGEYYVSMLTLQFFEDSNQYKVNFTAGTQRVYPASGSDDQLAADIFSNLFLESNENDIVRDNRSWPQGYQRWGRNAGCAFFQRYPSEESWGDRYFCSEPSANKCTGDRLMSGRCSLYQYGSGLDASADQYWYTRSSDPVAGWYASTTDQSIPTTFVDNPGGTSLPPAYRYLSDVLGPEYGGFLSAMDYAPVVTGQVNCQDAEPSPGALKFAIDEVKWEGNEDDWLEFSDQIAEYGGQIYSDRSRCFVSSLLLLAESYIALTDSSVFDKAGLCYLANCYTEDYLQIGVKTTLGGTKWFRCSEESNVYVAGFVGAFECPDPVEFCQYEDITGVKYAENNETLEWVFWGVLLGVILILFLVFCCCKKVRSSASRRIKELMNFDLVFKQPRRRPNQGKSPGSVFLLVISVIWVILGTCVFGLGITSVLTDADALLWENAGLLVFHFMGLGLLMIILAVLGIMTANADRQTLKAAFYLYINMLLVLVFIFLSVITLGIPSWLEIIIEIAWEQLHAYFPDSWQTYTAAEAWEIIWAWYLENYWIVYLIIGWNAFCMVGGMICAFVMLTFRNVLGTMLFWMNCVVLVAGVAFLVCCYVLVPILPTDWLAGLFLSASLTVVAGAVGVFVCRKDKVLVGWLIYTGVAFLAMLVMGIFLFVNVEVNAARVAELSEQDLAEVVERLSFIAGDWTETSLRQFLDSNVQAAAIAQMILALVILATMGAGLLVLRDVREAQKEQELAEAGHKQDYARKRGGRTKEWERAQAADTLNYNEKLKKRNEDADAGHIELQVMEDGGAGGGAGGAGSGGGGAGGSGGGGGAGSGQPAPPAGEEPPRETKRNLD